MAQREPDKKKRRPAKADAAIAKFGAETLRRLEARAAALESERDSLKEELEEARAKIAALEQTRDQVVDRIDWVIDSLQNLLEARA